jgi:ribonuclease HII
VTLVAGVDEAGRGPLAGPVYVSAVILPEKYSLEGLTDSKKLCFKTRERLEEEIKACAIAYSVVAVEPDEIDKLNILWASMEGMTRALESLETMPSMALIDGNRLPKRLPCPAEAVVQGDAIHDCISAASILAKQARDRRMIELAEMYPQYGFDRHFGYPTPEHKEALRIHGPCPIHRKSFTLIAQPEFDF